MATATRERPAALNLTPAAEARIATRLSSNMVPMSWG